MLWNSNSNNNLFVDAFSYSINSISNKNHPYKQRKKHQLQKLPGCDKTLPFTNKIKCEYHSIGHIVTGDLYMAMQQRWQFKKIYTRSKVAVYCIVRNIH